MTIIGNFNFDMFGQNELEKILSRQSFVNELENAEIHDHNARSSVVSSNHKKGFGGRISTFYSDNYLIYYQTNRDENENESNFSILQNVEKPMNNDEEYDGTENCVIEMDENLKSKVEKRSERHFSSFFFKNVIITTFNKKNIQIKYFCVFNSFLHGMIETFFNDPQCRKKIILNARKCEFFNKIIELLKCHDEGKKN